ncbi:FapA family protein [Defluviitalea saccharophila]|uniref:FapA family protein n=1 Tax=Defluviitalea saccharophila TaxID=879970 RepID=A0ABZ2YA02_9FIRM
MKFNVIYSNPYIQLVEKDDGFYIESFKKGYTLEELNQTLIDFPQVKITNFLSLKRAVMNAPQFLIKFGEVRERVEVEISSDHLKGYVTLYVPEAELIGARRKQTIMEITEALQKKGIVYGIKQDVLLMDLKPKVKILIAEGKLPVDGKNSIIKMYEITEPKPEITEDGTVNHYELNLINKVSKGDWLGERIDATPGEPGKSILGETIPAKPGKQFPLYYDKHSVEEVYDEEKGITTLIAKKTGAVFYRQEVIYVYDCLEIEGSVSFDTGNINFDGFVNIKGSIEDNFSVEAKNDIQVMGVMGVGSVEKIKSRDGCIYIRGGIAGKNKAHLYCKQDLYTKFASECTIECEETVHIGFYAINCNIKAKQVIFESRSSRIIGGNIDAEIKVVANEVGNRSEIPTNINIQGFNRKELKERLDEINKSIQEINDQLIEFKHKIAIYAGSENLSEQQQFEYKKISNQFQEVKETLKHLQSERKKHISYLRTKGEGEISISGQVHGNTTLTLKKITKRITNDIKGPVTYYVMDNELICE